MYIQDVGISSPIPTQCPPTLRCAMRPDCRATLLLLVSIAKSKSEIHGQKYLSMSFFDISTPSYMKIE